MPASAVPHAPLPSTAAAQRTSQNADCLRQAFVCCYVQWSLALVVVIIDSLGAGAGEFCQAVEVTYGRQQHKRSSSAEKPDQAGSALQSSDTGLHYSSTAVVDKRPPSLHAEQVLLAKASDNSTYGSLSDRVESR